MASFAEFLTLFGSAFSSIATHQQLVLRSFYKAASFLSKRNYLTRHGGSMNFLTALLPPLVTSATQTLVGPDALTYDYVPPTKK